MGNKGVHILIIILLTSLIYANTFQNQFVWDDYFFIVNWELPHSFENLKELWLGATPPNQTNSYRPIASMYYVLTYSLFGLEPFWYHLMNLLMHVGASILVYFIILRMLKNNALAFLTALFFAIHPMHSEVVNFMTSTYLPAALFILGSFYLYLLSENGTNRPLFACSLVLALIAYFSYELTLVLPALILFYELVRKKYHATIASLPYFVCAAIFMFIRDGLLNTGFREDYLVGSFYLTQLAMVKALLNYVLLTIIPYPLTNLHTVSEGIVAITFENQSHIIQAQSLFDAHVLFAILSLVSIAAIAFLCWKSYPVVTFAIGWFFIGLLPVMNFVPTSFLIAERYAYISLLGPCLLLAMLIEALRRKFATSLSRYGLFVLFLVVIVAFSAIVVQRNMEWRNEGTLWTTAVRHAPASALAHNNLGYYYMQVQDYSRAAELFATAYQINPSYLIALKNLASVYMKMGDAEWAVQIMEQYVQLVAQDAQAWNDLGSYNYVLERFAFAQVSFERSLAIQESVYAFLGLGSSYQMQGNFSLAESNYLKALEIDSTNVLVHFNLADMYLQLERYDLASHAFKQVLALEPDNVIAKQTLELMQKHNYNNPQ